MKKTLLLPAMLIYTLSCMAQVPAETPAQQIVKYTAQIQARPNDMIAFLNRGRAYSLVRKMDSALMDYNHVLESGKMNVPALYGRGQVFELMHKSDSAIRDFTMAIQINPRNYNIWSSLGGVYMILHKYDSAIFYYSGSLLQAAKNTFALTGRGQAYLNSHKYDSAISDFTTAINIEPQALNPWIFRANAYYETSKYDLSLNDYSKAIQLKPDYAMNIYNCIAVYCGSGLFSKASDLYSVFKQKSQAAVIENNNNSFLKNYIVACTNYLAANDYSHALPLLLQSLDGYRTAIRADDPINSAHYANILARTGWVYEQMGNKDKALEYYKKVQIISSDVQDIGTSIARLTQKVTRDIVMDTSKPTIELLTPKVTRSITIEADNNGANQIFVSGIAKDITGIGWVKVNGVDVTTLKPDGYFAINVSNTITTLNIQASDKNSNIATATFKIEKPSSPQPAAALNSGAIPPITASDQPVFHAVLIACSNYSGGKWPQLPTTISESQSFKNILSTSYGFDTANILELYDKGYVDILSGLSSKLQSLKDNDNLVIFFAGHGTYKQAGNELIGYWVPLNASAPEIDYISNKKLDELIAGTKVKHILMLSDACYGAAMRGENDIKTPSKYEYQLRSRQVLTSGGLEKVPGESVFVKMVSKALAINTDPYISASSLYNLIYNGVKKEADTEPKLFDFGKDGNEGGQFYFIKKKS